MGDPITFGVTRIESDSDDFADGRFVAVGFLGPQ